MPRVRTCTALIAGAHVVVNLHLIKHLLCARVVAMPAVAVMYMAYVCLVHVHVHVHAQTMNKVVFIREAVSEDVANNMIALTLYLDSLDKKRIYYWLNCPGGDVSRAAVSSAAGGAG